MPEAARQPERSERRSPIRGLADWQLVALPALVSAPANYEPPSRGPAGAEDWALLRAWVQGAERKCALAAEEEVGGAVRKPPAMGASEAVARAMVAATMVAATMRPAARPDQAAPTRPARQFEPSCHAAGTPDKQSVASGAAVRLVGDMLSTETWP